MNKRHTIIVSGEPYPILTEKEARASGMGPLTTPILAEKEEWILASIIADMERGGGFRWGLTVGTSRDVPCVSVWRTGMVCWAEARQELLSPLKL